MLCQFSSFTLVTYKSILLVPATAVSLTFELLSKTWSNSSKWDVNLSIWTFSTACWRGSRAPVPAVLFYTTHLLPVLAEVLWILGVWVMDKRECPYRYKAIFYEVQIKFLRIMVSCLVLFSSLGFSWVFCFVFSPINFPLSTGKVIILKNRQEKCSRKDK